MFNNKMDWRKYETRFRKVTLIYNSLIEIKTIMFNKHFQTFKKMNSTNFQTIEITFKT